MKTIDVDSWLADEQPYELKIGGKTFRARPVTYNQALEVSELVASMGKEYLSILQDGNGEQSTIGDREANLMIRALISKLTFAGPRPDWWQRRRIARRLRRQPIVVRLLAIKEISEGFTVYLRRLLGPLVQVS